MSSREKNKALIFILTFLGLLCALSFVAGWCLNSAAAFGLSGAALIPFFALFAVGVLDYKVGGAQLNLERRFDHLETKNTELRKIVTALSKAIYITHETGGRLGGPSIEHKKLISNQLEEIYLYLNESDIIQVKNEIRAIDEELKKKKEQNKNHGNSAK